MTDTRNDIQQATEDAKDTRGHRGIWLAFAVIMAGLALLAVAYVFDRQAIRGLETRADDNARTAQLLAEQVTKLGGVPVVRPPEPERGPQGERGQAGRGIAGTAIVDGRLLIAYDDGTSRDVGQVVGQPGANGTAGRGVVGTAIVAGHLVLSYSDSTTEDVGQVVGTNGDDGTPGRGVTSVAAVDGRLVVTYSDGTSQDAGPLPTGPPGRGVQRAEVVNCRWQVTYTDGTTEDAGNACVTETVTPAPTTTTPGLPLPPTPSR